MSRATSFASVSQQMSGAVGVAVAAICVEAIQLGFGDTELMARDLSLAFVLVAIVSSLSVFVFARLKPDAGAAVSGRMVSTSEEAQRGGRVAGWRTAARGVERCVGRQPTAAARTPQAAAPRDRRPHSRRSGCSLTMRA